MFASIRKYNVRRGSADELASRVRDGFVPMMRQMEGFRGYYLLDGGPDVLITISIFDSADEAFASNEEAADWVRNNVLEFQGDAGGHDRQLPDRRGQIAKPFVEPDGDSCLPTVGFVCQSPLPHQLDISGASDGLRRGALIPFILTGMRRTPNTRPSSRTMQSM
jgi:heme-degrading monooxygenase HmoA